MNKKVLSYAAVAYIFALVTSPVLPEFISLLFPFVGVMAGTLLARRQKGSSIPVVVPEVVPEAVPGSQAVPISPIEQRSKAETSDPELAPILEYLEVLEDMVISEGQKNNLDDEIVEKSLALFARLQRVIPLLQELNNGNINHTIRRLVLKDLNSFITPFLRLSGETKTKNRRMLLNGLKDINAKISMIVETIEHKDLIELQTKADLIHSRYSESDHY